MGAASGQGNSHDKYVRDLTDSSVLGMDQISANSMHQVPHFLHCWPRDVFPARSPGRQAAGSPLLLVALSLEKLAGTGDLQGSKSSQAGWMHSFHPVCFVGAISFGGPSLASPLMKGGVKDTGLERL